MPKTATDSARDVPTASRENEKKAQADAQNAQDYRRFMESVKRVSQAELDRALQSR